MDYESLVLIIPQNEVTRYWFIVVPPVGLEPEASEDIIKIMMCVFLMAQFV